MLTTDIFEGTAYLTHRMSKGRSKTEYRARFSHNDAMMIHLLSGAYSTAFEAQVAGRFPPIIYEYVL